MEKLPHHFGRYVLVERIAAGGMAEIFKATSGEGPFRKTVVVKRILPHLTDRPDFVSMFRDEAMITLKLSHANIVQVFDFGNEDGHWFLAMEYVHGRSLADVIKEAARRESRLPVPLAVHIAAEAARGLAHAHNRRDDEGRVMGIVHRDISPHNVLVSFEGEVKVTDFGIARARGRSVNTASGVVKGKAPYLSPEQLHAEELDARTDVYALGTVLFEMLAGRRLVASTGVRAMEEIVAAEEWPPVSSIRPDVPTSVDALVARAIAKKREDRTPNATSLMRECARIAGKTGVTSQDVAHALSALFGPPPGESDEDEPTSPAPRARGVIPSGGAETPTNVSRTRMARQSEIPQKPERTRTRTTSSRERTVSRKAASASRTPAITGIFENAGDFVLYALRDFDGKAGMFIETGSFEHRPGTILRAVVELKKPRARRFTVGVRVLWRRRKNVVEGGELRRAGIAVEFLNTAGDDLAALREACGFG